MDRRDCLMALSALFFGGCGALPGRGAAPVQTVPEQSLPARTSRAKPRIGLALGGGAARGFAHIGVIKALGATNSRIFRDVAAEAVLLGFLSTMLGVLIGLVGCYFLQTRGIDTSAWAQDTSFGGVAFDPIWRGAIRAASIYVPVALMWLICFFASVYPAFLMVRLNPVEAIASHG